MRAAAAKVMPAFSVHATALICGYSGALAEPFSPPPDQSFVPFLRSIQWGLDKRCRVAPKAASPTPRAALAPTRPQESFESRRTSSPQRLSSACLFMRGLSDNCDSDLIQEARFHRFHRFPAPLPAIFTIEQVHDVGRWRTALPASMGNEKDVYSCPKKGFRFGQRARPALAPMIPEHRRGTDHFRPTYIRIRGELVCHF